MTKPAILLLTAASAGAATITWDNGATLGNGNPDSSFLADENWETDVAPGASDDARLLTHSDAINPVTLGSPVTVRSVVCRVPFDLDETLTVTAASEFENALLSGGIGRLRANGPVTLTGVNALNSLALDGTAGFTNDGVVTLGTRGIGSTFANTGVATLLGGNTGLGTFTNTGTLNLGERGQANSSSTIINSGTVRKDNPAQASSISSSYTQTDGLLNIGTGATLSLNGLVQVFQDGTIDCDGMLDLTQLIGGTPDRSFEGLTEVSGDGRVRQLRSFQVKKNLRLNLPNAPGYEMGDLQFGAPGPPATTPTLTNEGYVTIPGSPDLFLSDPFDTASRFHSLSGATVEQGSISNPTFFVEVENDGTWLASSMKIRSFLNDGSMTLRGDSKTIAPPAIGVDATFANRGTGTVGFDESIPFNRCTVTTNYNQQAEARTTVNKGILNLDGGSLEFCGTFDVGSSDTLNINKGIFLVVPGGSSTNFFGAGTVTVGNTLLDPEILPLPTAPGTAEIWVAMGGSGNTVDTTKGFRFRSGRIQTKIVNSGHFEWQGGTVEAHADGRFRNFKSLSISAGSRPRILNCILVNSRGESPTSPATITQSASLALDGGSGAINNYGLHRLRPGASLSGGAPAQYTNFWSATLLCENGANALVDIPVDNQGRIEVTNASNLSLPELQNLDAGGILTGGTYRVDPDASISLPRPVTSLDGATWIGPGATTVTSLRGRASRLRKTTSETHPGPLVAEEGATVELDAGTTTTVPEIELQAEATLKGSGQLFGDLDLQYGTVAPGSSPGTLTVSGTTTFTADSTYEWEAASAGSADLLALGSPVTLSGTLVPVLLDDYLPTPGQSFTILTAPAVTGSFDFVDLSRLPPGLTVTPTYNASSVSLSFTTTSFPTYDSWKQTRFTPAEQADPLISGPDADPDGDGITNAAEYAHGLNPKSPDAAPVRVAAATGTSIDLVFPWATGTEASYEVRSGPLPASLSPLPSSLQSSSPLTAGVDELVIRTTHPLSTRQFNELGVTLP